MDTSLKKPIALTIAVLVVLIIILVISNSNVTVNVFAIVILVALIALIWFKYVQEKHSSVITDAAPLKFEQSVDSAPKEATEDDTKTKTGSPCEKAGLYVCRDHPKRKVNMKEGNRFPPCRGDKKGHSAVWVLKE